MSFKNCYWLSLVPQIIIMNAVICKERRQFYLQFSGDFIPQILIVVPSKVKPVQR